jgi:HEAT repeat protein
MRLRRCVVALIVLGLSTAAVRSETPSASPLADYDEMTLRQFGVETDAASLLSLLRQHTRIDGDSRQIKSLVAQLGSTQFEERERAAQELSAIGRPAQEILRTAQRQHVDPEVRLRAGHQLALLESKLDGRVTMSAVRRLIHLRASGAAERLLDVLPLVDWEIQDEIFHGLPRVALRDGKLDPALLAALEDPSPLRRAAAALTVTQAGNDATRARVRKLLADQDAEVRLRAAQGLLAVHDATSLPVLIALLNEANVEISWSAEELLHWVAGTTAPTEVVGAASATERNKAVAAWTAWRKLHGARIDWERLEQEPRRPSLYLICGSDSVWLGGCDGKRKLLVEGQVLLALDPCDALLLPGNELLILPRDDDKAAKYNLAGDQVWKCRLSHSPRYVTCQRLPGGTIFLAGTHGAVELNAHGEIVSRVPFDSSLSISDAWKLRSGKLVIRTDESVVELDGVSGHIIREANLPRARNSTGVVLPDGRSVFAIANGDRLVETASSGWTLKVVAVPGASSIEALRNGNYLVVTGYDHLVEVDRDGHTLREVDVNTRILRVRSILDKVQIGFEKAWPSAADRKAIARELGGLHHPHAEARKGAALALGELRPTDETSLHALCAVLDDDAENVRVAAATALALIGEAAVPTLKWVLTKGTLRSRLGAASALKEMHEAARTAAPLLGELVRDDTQATELRCAAAAALGATSLEAEAAVPALLVALAGQSDEVREAAASNVVKLTRNDPRVLVALRVVLLDKDHPRGQLAAVSALLTFDAKSLEIALPALVELLRAPADNRLCSEILNVVERLRDRDGDIKPAVPILLKLLKDATRSDGVRIQSAWLLTSPSTHQAKLRAIGQVLRNQKLSDRLTDMLVYFMDSTDGVVELAGCVNEGALPTRQRVIEHLGKLGKNARPALAELRKARHDPDKAIRTLAERALASITAALDGDLPVAEAEVVP